jgi:hypothetical protein
VRAFVVGNGVSLKQMDLDLLIGEVTFAMNRVDLVYEPAPDYGIRGTAWRPTYYLFHEWLGATNPQVPMAQRQYDVVGGDEDPWLFDNPHPKHVVNNPFRDFVIPHHLAPGVEQCILRSAHMPVFDDAVRVDRRWRGRHLPSAMWIPAACPHAGMYVKSNGRPTAWHLPVWCKYGGTMNTALQFAFAMGFDPVYVIACDLDYQPIYRESVADPNHFHPDYWTWEDTPLEDRDATLIEMHSIARAEFEKAGRRIYNAGIGGKLDVYERVDFATLF